METQVIGARRDLYAHIDLSKITVEIMMVTPEKAKEWLAEMGSNRPLLSTNLNKLRRQIEGGHWMFNGQPIIFDTSGSLRNGQHRLQAVVQTGISVPLIIVRGVEPGAYMTMDTGAKRSASQVVKHLGYTSAATLVSVATMLYLYELGGIGVSGVGPSTPEIVDVIKANPDLPEAVKVGSRLRHYTSGVESGLALGYLLTKRVDAEAAAKFVEDLESGSGLESGHPILALRNRFIKSRRGTLSREITAALYIKAWNFWVRHEPIQTLIWRPDETFPIPLGLEGVAVA